MLQKAGGHTLHDLLLELPLVDGAVLEGEDADAVGLVVLEVPLVVVPVGPPAAGGPPNGYGGNRMKGFSKYLNKTMTARRVDSLHVYMSTDD